MKIKTTDNEEYDEAKIQAALDKMFSSGNNPVDNLTTSQRVFAAVRAGMQEYLGPISEYVEREREAARQRQEIHKAVNESLSFFDSIFSGLGQMLGERKARKK